jgi:hypothetical protein
MAREEFETTNASLLDANNTGDQSAEIAAHTKTPWRLDPRFAMRIVANDDDTVASTGSQGDLRNQWEANADFIVRAVNAHEDLVAALQRMLLDLDKDGQAAAIATLNTLGRAALARATSTEGK